jgi:hypothetical protein
LIFKIQTCGLREGKDDVISQRGSKVELPLQKADMRGAKWNVRYGPKADSCAAAFSDLELSLGPRLLSVDPSKGGRMIWDAGPEKALTSFGCRDRGRHAGGGTRLSSGAARDRRDGHARAAP